MAQTHRNASLPSSMAGARWWARAAVRVAESRARIPIGHTPECRVAGSHEQLRLYPSTGQDFPKVVASFLPPLQGASSGCTTVLPRAGMISSSLECWPFRWTHTGEVVRLFQCALVIRMFSFLKRLSRFFSRFLWGWLFLTDVKNILTHSG